MLVAHYRIYSSLLVLRTCSIFGCQSWSWRGEMRIKLLLTDVLGSLALFALRCLQQVGERSSKRDFWREVQHTHTFLCPSMLQFLLGEPLPAAVQSVTPRATTQDQGHWRMSLCFAEVCPAALFRGSLGSLALSRIRSPEAGRGKSNEGTQLIRSL